MASLICGSVAYDTIMTFDGRFREHILPDQIHMLNVSFLVPGMRREFGGCAGNIAYTLKMLGGDPVVMATVGTDAEPYLDYLRKLEIAQRGLIGGVESLFRDNRVIGFNGYGEQYRGVHVNQTLTGIAIGEVRA